MLFSIYSESYVVVGLREGKKKRKRLSQLYYANTLIFFFSSLVHSALIREKEKEKALYPSY